MSGHLLDSEIFSSHHSLLLLDKYIGAQTARPAHPRLPSSLTLSADGWASAGDQMAPARWRHPRRCWEALCAPGMPPLHISGVSTHLRALWPLALHLVSPGTSSIQCSERLKWDDMLLPPRLLAADCVLLVAFLSTLWLRIPAPSWPAPAFRSPFRVCFTGSPGINCSEPNDKTQLGFYSCRTFSWLFKSWWDLFHQGTVQLPFLQY